MEKPEMEFWLTRLNEEKEKVMHIIEKMNNSEDSGFVEEYYTELSSYDNHPADLGTETFFMEQDKGLIDKLNNTLAEIEESILELRSYTYGICKTCGKEIQKERLELIPYLKICIDCANKKMPLREKMKLRPEEEDSISPFSKDHSEGNAYDREDSYQDVARYNRIDKDPSFGTGDDIGVFDDHNSGYVEEIEKVTQRYYDKIKE